MNDNERYEFVVGCYADLCDEVETCRTESLSLGEEKVLIKAIQMDLFQIGEHMNKFSENIKKHFDAEDLRGIVDIRNIIGHGYRQVDMNVIWDLIDYECPKLLMQLHELFK